MFYSNLFTLLDVFLRTTSLRWFSSLVKLAPTQIIPFCDIILEQTIYNLAHSDKSIFLSFFYWNYKYQNYCK